MRAHAQSEGTIANTDDLLHCCHLTKASLLKMGLLFRKFIIFALGGANKYSQGWSSIVKVIIISKYLCSATLWPELCGIYIPQMYRFNTYRELEVAGSNPSCLRVKAASNLF